VLQEINSYTLSTAVLNSFKTNDIHCFIRNAEGMPYIPGSSLKGALRTALLNAVLLKRRSSHIQEFFRKAEEILYDRVSTGQKKTRLNQEIGKLEQKLLDYYIESSDKKELFRGLSGLSVSDSTPFANEDLVLLQKQDVVFRNEKVKDNPISLFREYARPGVEVEFSLTLDPLKLKKELGLTGIESLMEALQRQYELLLGTNGVFTPGGEKSVFSYMPIKLLKENSKGVFILGGGAGFRSKTVLAAAAPNRREADDAARKVLDLSFPGRKHRQDKTFVPRGIKIAEYNGKKLLVGLCRLSEV